MFQSHYRSALAGLLVLLGATCYARAQCGILHFQENHKLTDANASTTEFGWNVAHFGNTAVVAGSAESHVDVFERSGGSWTQTATLTLPSTGSSVAIAYSSTLSMEVVVVGSATGSVFVFQEATSGWADMSGPTATLTPSVSGGSFGTSVAISNDKVVVGAPYDDDGTLVDCGAVYVFNKPSGDWGNATENHRFFAGVPATNNRFGTVVDIDGDTLVGSAPGGARAFVYDWNGTNWIYIEPLSSPSATQPFWGESIAIDGDIVVVGDFAFAFLAGTAHVFERDFPTADAWEERAQLAPPPGHQGLFGIDVDIDGNTIVVGAPFDIGCVIRPPAPPPPCAEDNTGKSVEPIPKPCREPMEGDAHTHRRTDRVALRTNS